LKFRRDIPRQEFSNAVDRMLGDVGECMAQIRFGIEAVEFGRADQ
jgi:hypothetical protein